MPRNRFMTGLGLVALAALLAAAAGAFRAFSYLAAILIVGTVASSSVERWGSEFDLAPYGGLAAGLLATFVVGVTAIWLLWTPGQTEFTYVLGVPSSTLAYLVFLWILPLFGTVYYALRLFPTVGGDDVVEEIMAEAREAQSRERYPLAPERIDSSATSAPEGGDD